MLDKLFKRIQVIVIQSGNVVKPPIVFVPCAKPFPERHRIFFEVLTLGEKLQVHHGVEKRRVSLDFFVVVVALAKPPGLELRLGKDMVLVKPSLLPTAAWVKERQNEVGVFPLIPIGQNLLNLLVREPGTNPKGFVDFVGGKYGSITMLLQFLPDGSELGIRSTAESVFQHGENNPAFNLQLRRHILLLRRLVEVLVPLHHQEVRHGQNHIGGHKVLRGKAKL